MHPSRGSETICCSHCQLSLVSAAADELVVDVDYPFVAGPSATDTPVIWQRCYLSLSQSTAGPNAGCAFFKL